MTNTAIDSVAVPLARPAFGVGAADVATGETSGANAVALSLGVPGLPAQGTDLETGGMYALKARTSSARLPLFAAIVRQCMIENRPCFLVVKTRPEEFLARLQPCWDFNAQQMIEEHRLHVFMTQPEVPKKIFRYGADRFLQELHQFGFAEGAVMLFDEADDLLSLHDLFLARQQVEVLAAGLSQGRTTALLSFSRPSDRQDDPLNALMDYFRGIARLGGERNGLELTFQYWRDDRAVTAARSFTLITDERGLYEACESQAPVVRLGEGPDATFSGTDRRSGSRAQDDARTQVPAVNSAESASSPVVGYIHYNDFELDEMSLTVPGHWLRFLNAEEIMEADGAPELTTVLLAIDVQQVQHWARQIHTLRSRLSNRAQLFAYTDQPELDPLMSQFLLKAGANAVLATATMLEQLSVMLRQHRRQVYVRKLEADFDALWSRYLEDRRQFDEDKARALSHPAISGSTDDVGRLEDPPQSVPLNRYTRPPSGQGSFVEDSRISRADKPTNTIGKARRRWQTS